MQVDRIVFSLAGRDVTQSIQEDKHGALMQRVKRGIHFWKSPDST